MRPTTLGLLVSLSIAPTLPAQSARDSAAAVAAVEQFHAALTAGDSARAVSLLTDDVLILESGAIQTRVEYLGGHLGADMRASAGSKATRTLTKVTIQGDVAYIVSRSVAPAAAPPNTPPPAAGAAPANFVSETAELMIVSKTTDGWKIRAVHWSSRRRRV